LNEFEILQNTVEINTESSHYQRAVSSITQHIYNLQDIQNLANFKYSRAADLELGARVLEKYGVPYPGHMSDTHNQRYVEKYISRRKDDLLKNIKLDGWNLKFLNDIPKYIKDLDLKIINQSFNHCNLSVKHLYLEASRNNITTNEIRVKYLELLEFEYRKYIVLQSISPNVSKLSIDNKEKDIMENIYGII